MIPRKIVPIYLNACMLSSEEAEKILADVCSWPDLVKTSGFFRSVILSSNPTAKDHLLKSRSVSGWIIRHRDMLHGAIQQEEV